MSKLFKIVKRGKTWFTALNVALIMPKAQLFVLTAALLFTAQALKADLTGDTDSMHVNITVFTEEAEHLQP
jgi:Rad3-related DNA helicase